MGGPEQQKETPKLSEANARKQLNDVSGDMFLMNDDLVEELIDKSQSDNKYERYKFKSTLTSMKFIRDGINSFGKGQPAKKKRILSLLSSEERNACESTTFLLSRGNYEGILKDTNDAQSKYAQFSQLIYAKEHHSDKTRGELLATPEELAKVVSKMPTAEAQSYIFRYTYNVEELATYTNADVFTMSEAEVLAANALYNPKELEKELKKRKTDYESREHASADKILEGIEDTPEKRYA